MSRPVKKDSTISRIQTPRNDIWFLVLGRTTESQNKISGVIVPDLRDTLLINPKGKPIGRVATIKLRFNCDSVFAQADIEIYTAEGPNKEQRISKLCIVSAETYDLISTI